MLYNLSIFINIWFPWFSLLDLSVFLQFCMLYLCYAIFTTQNLYYILFYIIFQIFFFGMFLAIYQLEIFSAFLWMTEVVVILVCLFILFNTSPSGNINKVLKNTVNHQYSTLNLLVIVIALKYTYWMLPEYSIENFLLSSFLWDDYYESLNNENTNDLYGVFLSFYWLNSLEFLIIGLVLLIGSLLCVQLNKFLKSNKSLSYVSFFEIFDFFKDFSKILFMRKQSLVDQENATSSTRSFSKKVKK